MCKLIILFLVLVVVVYAKEKHLAQNTLRRIDREDLSCQGHAHYNATLTAYYPDFYSEYESDYMDSKGKKLRTLQDFIDGRAEFVTVSMDTIPKLKYGTEICVPEINEHFGRMIPLQVRDHSIDLKGKGFTRLDICVRTEADSYDNAVNRPITIYTSI